MFLNDGSFLAVYIHQIFCTSKPLHRYPKLTHSLKLLRKLDFKGLKAGFFGKHGVLRAFEGVLWPSVAYNESAIVTRDECLPLCHRR